MLAFDRSHTETTSKNQAVPFIYHVKSFQLQWCRNPLLQYFWELGPFCPVLTLSSKTRSSVSYIIKKMGAIKGYGWWMNVAHLTVMKGTAVKVLLQITKERHDYINKKVCQLLHSSQYFLVLQLLNSCITLNQWVDTMYGHCRFIYILYK